MIVRIAKLTIQTEKAEQFKIFFHQSHFKIVNFKGCMHVELIQESLNKNIFFTYSHWENEKMLEEYRNSKIFKSIWNQTKLFFSEKPQAWSLKSIGNE